MEDVVFRDDITVSFVQQVGGDLDIVRAARVSTGREGADESPGAVAGLIGYLMKHRHGTPFEHGSLTVRVEAPIFVAREWFRHRIGWSYNETSGRYSLLKPVFWVPKSGRPCAEGVGFKPARPKLDTVPAVEADARRELQVGYAVAWDQYQRMLKAGVAREVARSVLPLGIYTSFYATCNPRSLMHFLSLRTHEPDAERVSYPQAEIEDAARQLEELLRQFWPVTAAAWNANGRTAP